MLTHKKSDRQLQSRYMGQIKCMKEIKKLQRTRLVVIEGLHAHLCLHNFLNDNKGNYEWEYQNCSEQYKFMLK